MDKHIYEDAETYATAETISKFNELLFDQFDSEIIAYHFPEVSSLNDKTPLNVIKTHISLQHEMSYDEQSNKIKFSGKYLNTEFCHSINLPVEEVIAQIKNKSFNVGNGLILDTIAEIDSKLYSESFNRHLISAHSKIEGTGYISDSATGNYVNVFDTISIVTESMLADENIDAPEQIWIRHLINPIDTSKIKQGLFIEFYPSDETLPLIRVENLIPTAKSSESVFFTNPNIGAEQIFIDVIKERPEIKSSKDFTNYNDYVDYWNQQLRNRQISHKKDYFNDLIL